MSEAPIHSGGCLCGAIRYEVYGDAMQTSLCHCEDCRRASGAPAVAWTFFPPNSLRWIQGSPREIRFAGRVRSFCADCGSPLLFADPALPQFTEVNTCTLDEPTAFPPGDQCWMVDEIPWMRSLHALVRFDHTSPVPDSIESISTTSKDQASGHHRVD
jgi:hypothetical protein